MPRKSLKVEESRRACPGKAGDKNQDRLTAAGQCVYDGRKQGRECPEVVLKLVRKREIDLRQRLPEIETLEQGILITLQHRRIYELLYILPGNLDEALEYGLNE